MAEWETVDLDKQEEAVLHNLSSTSGVYVVGNESKNSPPKFRPAAPSKTWSSTVHTSKKRKLCLVVMVVLVIAVGGAAAIPIALRVESNKGNNLRNSGTADVQLPLSTACQTTLYPTVCVDSLSNRTRTGGNNPLEMVQLSLETATDSLTRELTNAHALCASTSPFHLNAALQDCVEFIQASLDSLGDTLQGLNCLNAGSVDDNFADLKTWTSAAITTQQTCLDGFEHFDPTTLDRPVADFVQLGNYCSMLLSNVLAFVSALQNVAGGIDIPKIRGHRHLLTSNEATANLLKRRLLATSGPSNANVIVAHDGSGHYRKIQDAVNQASQNRTAASQFIIYIKSGKYVETVLVPKRTNNVVFLGDGVGKTIISGNLSVIGSNVTTSATATLTVLGTNFVGRNFTVENTAGPANHQAVALRVAGDFAAFEMCEFRGFQDTLYTHTNRQFYLNCTIVGTVDFIFGNAAVVFQSSQILATAGLLGQQNTYTASGRTDPNQNTGITFQKCTFDGTASLKNAPPGTFSTYLGRPWKTCARTVVMESFESNLVNPTGWLEWNGATPNSTVYYAEYQNTGPGFDVSRRVSWSQQINASNAKKFTVNSFIQGKMWLPQANITYSSSL